MATATTAIAAPTGASAVPGAASRVVRKRCPRNVLSVVSVPIDAVSSIAMSAEESLSFEQAVAPEVHRLFGLAMTILGDHGEAEDAVQETVFSAWRAWSTLRQPSQRASWLTRICVNHCINRRRDRVRRILWSPTQWSAVRGADPPVFQGRLAGFDEAFKRLSRPQRAVFALHFEYGYTVDECARLIGCRPGTARSHLGRAVAKLRKEFADA
jgi:RNA polymerase sigma-70 factor, ECF subfamily